MAEEKKCRFLVRVVYENTPNINPSIRAVEVNPDITVAQFLETMRKEYNIKDENVILRIDDKKIKSFADLLRSIAGDSSNITIRLAQKKKECMTLFSFFAIFLIM
jgi:S1-C subfamily serine protease